ncbi:MAG TPA: hypothetical protein VL523_04755 [Terriglobia bacterium]|nr:hypothetical protein [Terriglobia bacterium]
MVKFTVRSTLLVFSLLIVIPAMAQTPRQPSLEAQRSAMHRIGFLVGRWAGEARLFPAQGEPVALAQTEDAQYRLDGLILSIEGVGRSEVDGKPTLQAFAIISYDDESGTYRMRAFNDGRFLECEVTLAGDGKGLTWGFTLGQVSTHSRLRVTDKGDWTELTEISIGSSPPRKFMELTVSPKK